MDLKKFKAKLMAIYRELLKESKEKTKELEKLIKQQKQNEKKTPNTNL